MIYKTVISRNFILSTNNRQGSTWVEHRAGDVRWTLPYKVGYTIILFRSSKVRFLVMAKLK